MSWLVKGIEYLIKYNVDLIIRSTITKTNINDIPSMIIFCHELGIKELSVMPFSPIGRASNNMNLIDTESFIMNYRKANKLAKEYNDSTEKTTGQSLS